MTRTLAALLLCLSGAAHAADNCQALADVAEDVSESRQAGIEGSAILSHYLVQMERYTPEKRAAVVRVIRIASDKRQKPDEARHTVYLKCKAGEFAPKKP